MIVSLKTLRHLIENLKENVEEINTAIEKTEGKIIFDQASAINKKGLENLSMCCNLSGES